jgi:hypothetical protein
VNDSEKGVELFLVARASICGFSCESAQIP